MAAAIDASAAPPGSWPAAPTWLVAVELEHGRRVVLGREPSTASLGAAVAASCAVPGVFEQVRVDGALLGDGGLLSGTHADLVAEAHAQGELPGLAFTLVISPLSAYLPLRRRLQRELATFAPAAPPALVLAPGPRARRAMGLRPLDVHRVGPMAEATAADLAADPRVLEALAHACARLRAASPALSGTPADPRP
jgi:NTE family protein